MKKIKLSEWAKRQGLTYKTAWNHVKRGLLNERVEINEAGSIFIIETEDKSQEIFSMIKDIHSKICG